MRGTSGFHAEVKGRGAGPKARLPHADPHPKTEEWKLNIYLHKIEKTHCVTGKGPYIFKELGNSEQDLRLCSGRGGSVRPEPVGV